jgi:hypothetical protein
MNSNFKKIVCGTIIFLFLPLLSFGVTIENPLKYGTFDELVNAIINFILTISLAVVPLLVIWGAVLILISGGNPEKISEGKRIITWSLIGFAIILSAKGLIALVRDILGG